MRKNLCIMLSAVLMLTAGCGCGNDRGIEKRNVLVGKEHLTEAINEIIKNAPGTVGVAYVSSKDTVLINNGVRYPMMSVFKLHEALSVADFLRRNDRGVDSVLVVEERDLDRNTWSPMLEEARYATTPFKVSVGELMRYALTSSDNNASNILFERIVSPKETDAYIRRIAPDTAFSIAWSERDMKRAHELAYENYTSPLSAALLIKEVYSDERYTDEIGNFIKKALSEVTTGEDRLGSGVSEEEGVYFAHKTGSGYRNHRGELSAHNDVGYFRLADGRDYALAVFVRDFRSTEEEASEIIASISKAVRKSFN